MSRYSLKPLPHRSDIFEVVVGWDPGLDTFFVQVFGTPEAYGEPGVRLWRGTSFREILMVDVLLTIAGDFAEIPGELSGRLNRDRRSFPHDPMRPITRIFAELVGHRSPRK